MSGCRFGHAPDAVDPAAELAAGPPTLRQTRGGGQGLSGPLTLTLSPVGRGDVVGQSLPPPLPLAEGAGGGQTYPSLRVSTKLEKSSTASRQPGATA